MAKLLGPYYHGKGGGIVSYLDTDGFSIYEGGKPFNFHLSWSGYPRFFYYIYFFGFRWHNGPGARERRGFRRG